WSLEQRSGRVDPGVLLWHADFVEALVTTGAKTEATDVLDEVCGFADRLHRDVALLGLARAGAVLMAATGEPRDGADQLSLAVQKYSDHPYPLEVARAWHVLGGLERRAHRRGAARAARAEAGLREDAAGAVPCHPARRAK